MHNRNHLVGLRYLLFIAFLLSLELLIGCGDQTQLSSGRGLLNQTPFTKSTEGTTTLSTQNGSGSSGITTISTQSGSSGGGSSGGGSSGDVTVIGTGSGSSGSSMTVTLDRACSVDRGLNGVQGLYTAGEYFEQAKNPILALETQSKPPVVIGTVSLAGVSLVNSPDTLNLSVNFSAFVSANPQLANSNVDFYVCDDSKNLGSCDSYPDSQILNAPLDSGNLTPQIPLKNLPMAVTIYVFANKGDDEQNNQNNVHCDEQKSPLVLDLSGNGIALTGVSDGVWFDLTNKGLLQTSWTASGIGQGFLVRDISGNGEITSGGQLFGNFTTLSNGMLAANGFEALKALDSNGNGQFDHDDAAWSQVKVWIDINQDGISQPNELYTLDQLGIESIDLNYVSNFFTDTSGNQCREQSIYYMAQKPYRIVDAYFATGALK